MTVTRLSHNTSYLFW